MVGIKNPHNGFHLKIVALHISGQIIYCPRQNAKVAYFYQPFIPSFGFGQYSKFDSFFFSWPTVVFPTNLVSSPVNRLFWISNFSNDLMFKNDSGIVPDNWFPYRNNISKVVNCPSSFGIVPDNWLEGKKWGGSNMV